MFDVTKKPSGEEYARSWYNDEEGMGGVIILSKSVQYMPKSNVS